MHLSGILNVLLVLLIVVVVILLPQILLRIVRLSVSRQTSLSQLFVLAGKINLIALLVVALTTSGLSLFRGAALRVRAFFLLYDELLAGIRINLLNEQRLLLLLILLQALLRLIGREFRVGRALRLLTAARSLARRLANLQSLHLGLPINVVLVLAGSLVLQLWVLWIRRLLTVISRKLVLILQERVLRVVLERLADRRHSFARGSVDLIDLLLLLIEAGIGLVSNGLVRGVWLGGLVLVFI